MKLSAAITSRDLNSGSANFIDDIRSFKMSHSLSTPTNQQDTKCGYLKFTFFVGDKMAKIEHEIGQFKEIDILEIEDEITAEYMEAMMELEKSGKVPKELTGLISVLDSDKETNIVFLDLSLSREKYNDEDGQPFCREYNRREFDIKDPHIIFTKEGKSVKEAELNAEHIRIRKVGDVVVIFEIGKTLKETGCIEPNTKKKIKVDNLVGMKIKENCHGELYETLNEPFVLGKATDWYDLSGRWLLRIVFWLHSHYLLSEEIFYSSKKE